ELAMGMVAQRLLMRQDTLAAERLDIVDRGPEADRLNDGWRARLELMWRVVIGDGLRRHLGDHLASTLIGPQAVEPLPLRVEDADAGRAVELVPGEAVEID